MKLYTEEQIRYFFECGRNYQNNAEITFRVARDEMPTKPIELPSEDEIYHNVSNWVFHKNSMKWSNNDDTAGDNLGSFIAGAKWMRDKIQGGGQ